MAQGGARASPRGGAEGRGGHVRAILLKFSLHELIPFNSRPVL